MGRLTVLGRSGTGKSYYVGTLLEQAVPDFDIALHFDIEDEEIGLSHPDHDPLYATLEVDREKADRANWARVIARHKKLRIVPDDLTTDELRVLYAELCRQTMRLCKDVAPDASAFVSCDEAHNILPQNDFYEACERLITGGRKHSVEHLAISQRPQLLHSTVISQADKRVYFAISDDNDLGKINKQSGFDADILRRLPSRCCIVENKNSGDYKLIVTDPDVESSIPSSMLDRVDDVEVNPSERKRPHFSGDDGIVDQHLPV